MPSLTLINSMQRLCPDCAGRGIRPVTLGDTPVFEPCPCMAEQKRSRILKNSKITPEFQKLTFDNFTVKGKPHLVAQALKMATAYVTDFKNIRGERCNSLALLGQPGVGKTHLSCAVANALMAQGVPVLYFPHREGFGELKSSLGGKSKKFYEIDTNGTHEEKIDTMKKIDLLVWDDLFKGQRLLDYEFEVVFEVLNYRYINHLPVVVSSELLVKDLLKLDQGVGRRIIEPARGHLVEFSPNPAMIHGLM